MSAMNSISRACSYTSLTRDANSLDEGAISDDSSLIVAPFGVEVSFEYFSLLTFPADSFRLQEKPQLTKIMVKTKLNGPYLRT
ncbi:MAG: hypothetical protein B6D36_03100 [Planctomycetes bacterium UTPLA1]|nr:MAG: hypothetical protein B6D36_03100 [Planctomycetes bacterium UTPLA1]